MSLLRSPTGRSGARGDAPDGRLFGRVDSAGARRHDGYLAINAAFFAADLLAGRRILYVSGASAPWPMYGEFYRLVTAGFLHGDTLHILMNSWVLFDLGAEVETIYDTRRLIVFYFVTTITGFLASSAIGHHVSVGSSAGIFGLIGTMLAFGFTDKSGLGQAVKQHYGRWVVYSLAMSFIPGIDLLAHVGGLVGGFVTAAALGTATARGAGKERAIQIAAWVAVAITLLCFGRMFLGALGRAG